MYFFSAMVASVPITTYALDSYPPSPGEVAGYINFARILGGFSVGYFQPPRGRVDGYEAVFGTQAGIIEFTVLVLVSIPIFDEG